MKKLLALLLAVTMLAAGNVGAMAADVPVETVSLEPRAMTLRVGDTKVITAKIIPTNATNKNVVWTSKNSSIAQVSSDGEVTAFSVGRTSIRATSADGGHWEQCQVTVIAADAPPITFNDKQPGETVHLEAYINDKETEQEGIYRYVSPEKIRSITFQSGLMVGRELNGRIRIKPTTPKYDVADVGTILTDIMVVTLADGSSYNFFIEMTFVDDVTLMSVENDDGLTLYDGIPMGGTYTYIFELCDKANIAKEPFHVTVEQNEDDGIVKVGQISTRGKKIFLPITPIRVGSTYMVISVEYQTDNGPREAASGWVADVVPASFDPGENDKPDKPNRPNRPERPENPGGGPVDDDDSPAPQATENKANEEKTQNALKAGNTVEVKLSNGTAALDLETMGILGGGRGTLTVINGRMTVDIPGGFGSFSEPGRIYFPFDYEEEPPCCSYEMNAAVKEGNQAKTETVKAGGNMVMPGTVTVTLKTRLTGTVKIYYYNDYNRRFTKLAEVPVVDGRVTFTTRQLGHLVLTTGTI